MKRATDKNSVIDNAAAASKMSTRSTKLTSLMRTSAWNEIFDVLLWSVSFSTKSFDKKDEKSSTESYGFSISSGAEYLDTVKAMPQLIRPQDLANVVQALFHQLLPIERRLSRQDFINKMESFTAGHGFIHNAENANSKILEALGDLEDSQRNMEKNDLLRNRSLSTFMSRRSSESLASNEEANPEHKDNKASYSRNYVSRSLSTAPSSFPINMLLNSRKSMGGQLEEVPVLKHANMDARLRRSHSSGRRVSRDRIGVFLLT